jgi:AraC family transcriptional regulator of adaptative response / DNA-3-methyladenine glycosylase II
MKKKFKDARIAKDKNFDGKFFFGVKTTGIFCRPSCPSPIAKEENVVYFNEMFEALEQHYRPCLRCRPDINIDYYNGNISGTVIVNKALKMIYDGYLNYQSITDLAAQLQISDRHLRKLFIESLGVPPVKIAKYHRALFAKKLLLFSNQSITDIAFASGFGSLRQFNQVFKQIFNASPSSIKKERSVTSQNKGNTSLLLTYQKPFNFSQVISFLKRRTVKGVEVVTEKSYARTFRTAKAKGYFIVKNNPKRSALELNIHCDDIKCYMEINNRVRRMFDLNTNFTHINQKFKNDKYLSKGMPEGRVPRLPIAFDPFEFSVRAVLGQQISVEAASTLASRIAKKTALKTESDFPEGLDYFFPDSEEITQAGLEGIGITGTRQATILNIAREIGENSFSLNANQPFEIFQQAFSTIKGVGEWTVNYVAMRGLGMVDSFPATDIGIIKAIAGEGKRPSRKQITDIAEKWRPYRAYAALCLWNQ